MCAGNPTFELADVFEAMERCIGRLTAEQYGSLDQQNEAVSTRDPEANLLGEACEMLAGNENYSDTMFIVDGKFKEDTHTRRYGFRFYQVPNSIGCVHLYRQTRDIRPNREGRWQKHEVNGTHMIAYKNAKTGWGWDKRTVGFWMDSIASRTNASNSDVRMLSTQDDVATRWRMSFSRSTFWMSGPLLSKPGTSR